MLHNQPWLLLLPLTAIVIGSCQPTGVGNQFETHRYFDLDSLIKSEFRQYQEDPPARIVKQINFSEASESQEQSIEEVLSDTAVFNTFDINKPAYLGVYDINSVFWTNKRDTLYSVVKNTLKPEEDESVKFINAYYNGSPTHNNLSHVLALKKMNNPMYYNAQVVKVDFEEGQLKQIHVSGWQKILFFKGSQYNFDILFEAN